jgi:hypothetical protein
MASWKLIVFEKTDDISATGVSPSTGWGGKIKDWVVLVSGGGNLSSYCYKLIYILFVFSVIDENGQQGNTKTPSR